jgi:hypothetical protein
MFLVIDYEIHYQLSGWLLGEMILLILKDLKEVKKNLVSSPSIGNILYVQAN